MEKYFDQFWNYDPNFFDIQVHKNDFIAQIKNMNMLKDFEMVDPKSEFHWKKKADLAFRCVQKAPFPPFLIFLSIAAFLMPILMDMLVKKNLNGWPQIEK